MNKFVCKALDLIYPVGVTCMFCGEELREVHKNGLCSACYEFPEQLDEKSYKYDKVTVYSSCRYDKYARDFVLSIKMDDKAEMTRVVALFIAELYNKLGFDCDCIAYVPSSKKNIAQRGYDHMRFCAGFLSMKLDLPVLKGFYRIKHGLDQTELVDYEERKKNIKGCFEYRGADLSGKKVLLIDDIVTSGATINECAEVLGKSNPEQIVCMTFARAESGLK